MGEAAVAGQMVSAAGGYLGEQLQAESDKSSAYARADELTRNAVEVRRQAAEDERQQRILGAKAIGNIRANYGASGVQSSEGSPLAVLQSSAAAAERDALNIRLGGEAKASAYDRGAGYERDQGDSAYQMHKLAAWGALLGGGGKAISSMPQNYPSGPSGASGGYTSVGDNGYSSMGFGYG